MVEVEHSVRSLVCGRELARSCVACLCILLSCEAPADDETLLDASSEETEVSSPRGPAGLVAPAPPPQPMLDDIALGDGGFALDGYWGGSLAGSSMSGVGDVNGDGIDDFVVGLRGENVVFLVFGQSSFPAGPLDLSVYTEELEMVAIFCSQSGAGLGYAVSGGGDFNGDGLADFVVGAPFHNAGLSTANGRSWVIYGSTTLQDSSATTSQIEAGTDNVAGFALSGAATQDFSGESVANAGDVNGDGVDDIIIGARLADPNGSNSGRSYVVFGSEDAPVDGVVTLASIAAGNGGFAINGAAAGDGAGFAVAGAGDVNGDGFDDVLVGAPSADPNGSSSGRVYVVYGDDDLGPGAVQLSQVAAGNGGFALDGQAASDFAGFGVSGAGDVNDDGFADVIVGAYGNDAPSSGAGRGYIVYGAASMSGSPIDLADIVSGSGGVVLNGLSAGDETGWSVGAPGDVNLDGLDDVLISARRRDAQGGADRGTMFLVYGADDPAITSATNVLSSTYGGLFGCGGWRKWGEANSDLAGHVVTGLGDVNGDGVPDMGAGAQNADPNGSSSGRAYVVFGDPDEVAYCSTYNRKPQLTDDVYWTTQDQEVDVVAPGVLANDFDADDDPLVLTSAGPFTTPLGGVGYVYASGRFTYQAPDPEWWGADEVEYTVSDGQGGISTATVRVRVVPSRIQLEYVAAGDGGFAMDGAAAHDGTGQAVAIVGDIGQGPPADLLIGAHEADPAAGQSAGVTYLRYGTSLGVTSPVALTPNFDDALGEDAFDWSGISVAPAGDFDGDGQVDFLVGAIGADANGSRSGRAYLVFGNFDEIENMLGAIDGTNGVRFEGEFPEDDAGRAIAAAGDVNDDGFDDIIIGAYRSDLGDPVEQDFGRAYVVYGTGAALSSSVDLEDVGGSVDGFVIDGEAAGDFAGFALGGNVDVDDDGYDDVLVGAYTADPAGQSSGRTYVIYGGNAIPSVVSLADVANPTAMPDLGIAIDGEVAGGWSGRTVAGLGDIDGDGFDDILVGAPAADFAGPASGRVYVVFGGAGIDPGSPTIALEDVALGIGGFALDGEAEDDSAGASLSGAGDLNGDGFDDFIVGAPFASSPGAFASGRAYVVFGKSDWTGTTVISLADLAQGIGGFSIDGEFSFDSAGHSVGGGGDVDGDGSPDLVVGAPGAGATQAGRAYVIYGGDWFPPEGVVP